MHPQCCDKPLRVSGGPVRATAAIRFGGHARCLVWAQIVNLEKGVHTTQVQKQLAGARARSQRGCKPIAHVRVLPGMASMCLVDLETIVAISKTNKMGIKSQDVHARLEYIHKRCSRNGVPTHAQMTLASDHTWSNAYASKLTNAN